MKRSTSAPHPEHEIYPYLLRNVAISKVNQVWSADVGYPGDPAYREFYKDIGWELPLEAWDEVIDIGARSHYVAAHFAAYSVLPRTGSGAVAGGVARSKPRPTTLWPVRTPDDSHHA